MAFENFFNLYTLETQHVFSWLINSTEVDLADLIEQARQKAIEDFDEDTAVAEAHGDDGVKVDREKSIEDKIDEFLPEVISEFVEERLEELEFGEGDFNSDALAPNDKGRDAVECLVGGLVSCAMCKVNLRVVADAIKLHLKHQSEVEAT